MNESATTRRVALVDVITVRHSVHTAGYPLDPEKTLPAPDVILLVGSESGAMLYRYTAYGELAGDTLHASVTEAEEQALYEYGSALLTWVDVPDDIPDAHVFAVRYAADRLNERG